MRIFVGSAHIKCQHQRLWRELQWQFLKDTTKSQFEYYVVANALNPALFKHAHGVLNITNRRYTHSECISELLGMFKITDCTHCLLLDSDCWPIRKGWDQFLASKIGMVRPHLDSAYQFAAPVRTENLDLAPHPSAVFFARDELPNLRFDFASVKNLLGLLCSDVGFTLKLDCCYPLMKTNYISPHPVYASIYGDCFYHHCAGSRGAGVRSADYYRHLITLRQQRKIYTRVTRQLKKNPRKFIHALRGTSSRVQNSAVRV